jgi:hypothetical protein
MRGRVCQRQFEAEAHKQATRQAVQVLQATL